MITKEQLMAQAAFLSVSERQKDKNSFDEYKSFALSFPALIHSCGLVQAIAFARAKNKNDFINDLEKVFMAVDKSGNLQSRSREADIIEYTRISRNAISAASWIKRCCQGCD